MRQIEYVKNDRQDTSQQTHPDQGQLITPPIEHEPMNIAASDSATGLTSDELSAALRLTGRIPFRMLVQHPTIRALRKLWRPVPWMLEAAVLLQLALGEYGGSFGCRLSLDI